VRAQQPLDLLQRGIVHLLRVEIRSRSNIDFQRADALLRRPWDELGQRLSAERSGQDAYVHDDSSSL